MTSVEQRVVEVVVVQLDTSEDEVTRGTSFERDLGADSLDTVELMIELEDEFGISIPDGAAKTIQTVGQAIDEIEKIIESQSV